MTKLVPNDLPANTANVHKYSKLQESVKCFRKERFYQCKLDTMNDTIKEIRLILKDLQARFVNYCMLDEDNYLRKMENLLAECVQIDISVRDVREKGIFWLPHGKTIGSKVWQDFSSARKDICTFKEDLEAKMLKLTDKCLLHP